MKKPTVSVNLCCYNSEKYLRETLQSVVEQTYKDWELVIINDGSSDSTESIISEYIKHGYPVIYQYQENKGLGASRNEALKLSQGEFIAFIDHDDIWMPTKLEKQMPLFERNPMVGLVFCDSIFLKDNKNLYRLYKKDRPLRGMVFRDLLARYSLSMETVIVRKKTLLSLDHWFDDTLIMAEEMDLFLRIAYNWELDYVDEPLCKWRIHEESESYKHAYLIPKEKELILEKLTRLYPDFRERYSKEIEEQKRMINYQWALSKWKDGSIKEARRYLKPYIWKDKNAFLAYFLSYTSYNWYIYLKENYFKLKFGRSLLAVIV